MSRVGFQKEVTEGEHVKINKLPYTHVFETTTIDDMSIEVHEGAPEEYPYAVITIIREGISLNRFKYSKKILEELNKEIQTSGRRKMYVDHDKSGNNRSVKEWAATIGDSWIAEEDGKAVIKAKIDFQGAFEGERIMQAMKAHPEEVGCSIDAFAGIENIEESDGSVVKDVKEWYRYNSTDFVTEPSAGGGTDRVYADALIDLDLINEARTSLSDALEKEVEKTKVHELLYLFLNLLDETTYAYSDEFKNGEEKKKYIDELVQDFIDEFNNIDFVQAYEEINNEELIMEEIKTVEELKVSYPDLVKDMLTQAQENAVNEFKEKSDTEKKVSTLGKEVSSLKEEISAKEQTISEKNDELKAKTDELNQYKLKEELKEKTDNIKSMVSESKELPSFDKLPEFAQKSLLATENDEELDKAIRDIEEIYKAQRSENGKVEGLSETDRVEEGETPKVDLNDPKAVASFLSQ